MGFYLLKRLLLIFPTLFGIMIVNFIIINAAPGGPIEYAMSRLQETHSAESSHLSSNSPMQDVSKSTNWTDETIKDLKKRYGFDKPLMERFWLMIKNYLTFNFGDSYFKSDSVAHLIISKIPVTLSLGLWSTIIIYLISIPLGIAKAVYNRKSFDTWTSVAVVLGYSVPNFLFAMALLVVFAGGSFWSWFPLRGLTSSGWADLSWFAKIKDYFWHLALPITAQVLSGFAALTLLTKNSFLEEMHKQYVTTARAQGFSEISILMKTIFRNAMLIVIAGLPATLVMILFSGSLLIEMIFSIDGLGLLSYEAVMTRDYPIVFGSLYIFTLIGLFLHLISDLIYTWIDPRIDFNKRNSG